MTLQQILFYRELGFELKQIKEILGRADFEIVAALESRMTAHVWACVEGKPAKIINGYQPAGKMEEFFRGSAISATCQRVRM